MLAKPATALLIHGFPDRGASCTYLAKTVNRDCLDVLSPELPGARERAVDAGPFTLDRVAAEMVELLDRRPDEVLLIVGHSMGGQIADLVANQRPDRIAAIVLVTAVPLAGREMPEEARQLLQGAGGDAQAQRHILGQFSSNLSLAQIDWLIEGSGLMKRETAEDYYDASTAGHAAGRAPSIFAGPVLIMAAADDQVATVDQARMLKSELYHDADFKVIDHSGHLMYSEQPNLAPVDVLDFIGRSC